jgi:hypothetical protein
MSGKNKSGKTKPGKNQEIDRIIEEKSNQLRDLMRREDALGMRAAEIELNWKRWRWFVPVENPRPAERVWDEIMTVRKQIERVKAEIKQLRSSQR